MAVGEAGKLYPKTLEDEAQGRATWFLYRAKRYPEAERLLKGELALLKKQSALTTLAAADALNDLADVHCRQRKFQEAETEKKQSIEIKTNLIAKKLLDPDTNPTDWALADLALENFIEMRDKTASKTFRTKKKLDHFLEAALPGIYLPLYTMVTFTRIPYAEAARRGRRQDRIVYVSLVIATVSILVLSIWVVRSLAS